MPRQATNDTALNLLRNVPVIRWIWRGGTTGRSRPWWITGPLSRSNHINQGGRVLGQPPYTHLPPPSTFPGHSVMNSPASARRQVCITIKSVNLNVRLLFGEIYWLFSLLSPCFVLSPFFFWCPCASFSFVIKKSWKCWRSVPQPRRSRFMCRCRDDKLFSAKHNQEVASLNRCSSKRTQTRLFLLRKVIFRLCCLFKLIILLTALHTSTPLIYAPPEINGIVLSYWTPAATWKWNSPPSLQLHTGPDASDLYAVVV